MRVSSNLLLALLLASAASASSAATVCVTNKNGVGETWQTNEKDTSLLKSSGACNDVMPSIATTPGAQRYAPIQAVAMATQAAPAAPLARPAQVWHTTPADQTMRQLITKWSSTVGWTLVWGVDKDIPLESLDQTTGDFKSAVRRLLSTTALSDMNLKPCFYTNNVVRVVRDTTKCNPNE